MATPALRAVALAGILLAPAAWANAQPAEAPPPPESPPLPDPTSVTVDVGGSRIVLPAPAGWVELTTNRELVRSVIEATLPEENRHLSTFSSIEEVTRVDAGEEMTQWGVAFTNRALEKHNLTTAEFLQFRLYIRREWDKVIEAAQKKLGEENAKAAKRFKDGFGLDVDTASGKISTLGSFLDEPGAIGALMITEGGSVEGEEIGEVSLALVMMHVGSRLVAINVYRYGSEREDLEAAKAIVLQWKDAIRAANPEGDQPAM